MTDAPTIPGVMEVDYVADVVCPWCYVGWARLKRTFALRPQVKPHVRWRPYQLNPDLPAEGVDRKTLMREKFGADPARLSAMQQTLASQAAEDGLDLKFDEIQLSPNTNAAHRLIAWAEIEGRGAETAEAIMRAYFTELRDIGDPAVLTDIGAEQGLDRAAIAHRFEQGAGKDFIDQACDTAMRAGIQGVPFMIFADRVAVSGAHAPEELVKALDKAMELAP
jgi:predicted DsbA family dithiol-disulfide isomerase